MLTNESETNSPQSLPKRPGPQFRRGFTLVLSKVLAFRGSNTQRLDLSVQRRAAHASPAVAGPLLAVVGCHLEASACFLPSKVPLSLSLVQVPEI
jgi:hypothetical protein